MSERRAPVPEPQASPEMRAELSRIAWRVDRWIDLGPAAVLAGGVTAAAGAALLMPWVGTVSGWRVLLGEPAPGPLPRLFALVVAITLVVSALALLVRFWPLAWAAGAVCGCAVVLGASTIWALRSALPIGDVGPGLVIAVLAVAALAGTWVRISLHPPEPGVTVPQSGPLSCGSSGRAP